MIRITQGNDVTLCVPLVSKDTTGRYTPIPAVDVESLTVSVTSGGQEVDSSWWSQGTQSNLVLINLSESFSLGHYAITITGVYQDKDIRWASPNAFRIVQYNEQSTALNHLSLARQTIDSAVFIAAVATEGGGASEEDEINSYNWVHFIEAANTAFDLGFTEATDFTAAIEAFENYIEAHSGDDAVISPETLNAILDLFEGLTGQSYSAGGDDAANVTVKNRISSEISTAWGNLVSAVNTLAGSSVVSTSSTIGDVATAIGNISPSADLSGIITAVNSVTGSSLGADATVEQIATAVNSFHPTATEWATVAGLVHALNGGSTSGTSVSEVTSAIGTASNTMSSQASTIETQAGTISGLEGQVRDLTGDVSTLKSAAGMSSSSVSDVETAVGNLRGTANTLTDAQATTDAGTANTALGSQFSTLAGTIAGKTGSTAPTTLGGADTAVSGLPSAQALADSQDQTDYLLEPVNVLTGGKPNQGGNYSRSEAQAAATALSDDWATEDTSQTPPILTGGLVYAVKQKNTSAQLSTTSTMSEVATAINNIQTGQPPAPTVPLTNGQSNPLADNTIFTGSSMTDIRLVLPQSVPTGFVCEVDFSTSSSTVDFQAVSGCTILGDDCKLNSSNVVVFEPQISKSYSILFTKTNGSVFAYVVDTTSNA